MYLENQDILSAHRIPQTNINEKKDADIDLLNKLIADNLGMAKLFESAVTHLEFKENKELISAYIQQNETFVTELANLVISFGGKPVDSADVQHLLKEVWVTLKATFTSGDSAILVELAENVKNLLKAYNETLSENINDELIEVLNRHISEINMTLQKILALGAAYQAVKQK